MRFLLPAIFMLSCTFVYGQMAGTLISQFDRYGDGYKVKEDLRTSQSQIGWRGERLIFQALVWSSEASNTTVSFTGHPFKGEEDFSPKLMFPIPVKGDASGQPCGAWSDRTGYTSIADALSETPPLKINKGDTIPVWVSVNIPHDTEPGVYKSKLTVNELNFDLEIQVADKTLPPVQDWAFHLDLWQYPARALELYNNNHPGDKIDYWSDRHFNMIMPAYQILADAGQKTITAHIKHNALGGPSMVKWIKQPDDIWEYDFSIFDKYVEAAMQLGINKQISCFSPAGWNNTVIPYWDQQLQSMQEIDAPIGSEMYAERWDHFLTAFKQHLVEKNWFDITVLYLDEIPEAMLTALSDVVKANDPDWKLGIAASHGLSSAMKGKFYDASGMLGTSTGDTMVKTFYTSCTQSKPNNYVTANNSPSEMTWTAYYAVSNNFDGYLRWAYDNWRLNDPFDTRDNGNTAGDFSFIYRTSNDESMQFLSSIRLEALREGIEDFEKILILKEELEPDELSELNSLLAKFHKNSGVNAATLVPDAHEAIAGMGVTLSTVTAIAKDDRSGNVRVYPNPFGNQITVSGLTDPHSKVSLISPAGGIVPVSISATGNNMVLSTNRLANGFYVVEVVSRNGSRIASKLMIKE